MNLLFAPQLAVPAATAAAYAGVILTSVLASAINSIAGGGTFLTFPALTGMAGLGEKAANMTSTVGLWPGSAASIAAARSEFRHIPRAMLVTLGIMSFIGGTAGSLLLITTSNQTFRLVIPWLLAFATIVFGFSKPIARWAGRKHGSRSLKWTVLVAAVQFFVALYGGYFGAGIGVLMLAGLSFAGLDSLHQMNALKVLLATIINGMAVLIFVGASLFAASPADRIFWPLGLGMAAGSIAGGFIGMHFARKVKQDALRMVILAIGACLTAVYFYKAYAGN